MIRRRLATVLSLAAPLMLAGATALAGSDGLSADDDKRIRAVLAEYRRAWLSNDAEGVLRLFSPEAVLLPHHGVEPVVGLDAARAFWFPKDSPPTTITELALTVDQVGGSCDMAFARGHSRVSWVTGKGAGAKKFSNAGTNLTLLRRQADGSWRITHQMWDDPLPVARTQ